jgi:hypothetical protein
MQILALNIKIEERFAPSSDFFQDSLKYSINTGIIMCQGPRSVFLKHFPNCRSNQTNLSYTSLSSLQRITPLIRLPLPNMLNTPTPPLQQFLNPLPSPQIPRQTSPHPQPL